MSASLTTTNYGLGKYAPNDKTNWLVDFNENMDKIDAGMEANKQAAAAADEKATNAEASVSALTETVQGNSDSIEANEKAISANTAAIATLEEKIVGDYIFKTTGQSDVSLIDTLCTNVSIAGRGINNYFSGKLIARISNGTLARYTRTIAVPGISQAYCTDLARITGNPFGLGDDIFTRLIGNVEDGTLADKTSFVIGFVAASNFTVIGYVSSEAEPVTVASAIWASVGA